MADSIRKKISADNGVASESRRRRQIIGENQWHQRGGAHSRALALTLALFALLRALPRSLRVPHAARRGFGANHGASHARLALCWRCCLNRQINHARRGIRWLAAVRTALPSVLALLTFGEHRGWRGHLLSIFNGANERQAAA
jgi:hypothetical protein